MAVKKDKWGRSEGSKWYGYNAQTKKYEKEPSKGMTPFEKIEASKKVKGVPSITASDMLKATAPKKAPVKATVPKPSGGVSMKDIKGTTADGKMKRSANEDPNYKNSPAMKDAPRTDGTRTKLEADLKKAKAAPSRIETPIVKSVEKAPTQSKTVTPAKPSGKTVSELWKEKTGLPW